MKEFTSRNFNIPELKGISKVNIEEHLKLYQGYVKSSNLILSKIKELSANYEENSYQIAELQRRFGFEFDGMRNHEYYFKSFEGGHNPISEGKLKEYIKKEWGDFDSWLKSFKNLAKTRGVGWAILYFDKESDQLLNTWVDEQHLGHLTGLNPILALDMWEHSFVADYQPSGKAQYIEDFFENLNWKVIEDNFEKIN